MAVWNEDRETTEVRAAEAKNKANFQVPGIQKRKITW